MDTFLCVAMQNKNRFYTKLPRKRSKIILRIAILEKTMLLLFQKSSGFLFACCSLHFLRDWTPLYSFWPQNQHFSPKNVELMACLSAIHTVYFFWLILVQQQCDREVSKKKYSFRSWQTQKQTQVIYTCTLPTAHDTKETSHMNTSRVWSCSIYNISMLPPHSCQDPLQGTRLAVQQACV